MGVGQRIVPMEMSMPGTGRHVIRMLMLVMLVVGVLMAVFDRFVGMLVRVPFRCV